MQRTALLDSDILLYELGYSSEGKHAETGELEVASWEWTQDLLEKKINLIMDEARATDLVCFFTNTRRINKLLNRQRRREETPLKEFVPNFREVLAVEKEYKGGRKQEKPYHFYNILAHILGTYPCEVNENGLEADDAMCIRQYKTWQDKDTIICSRDKDVRQCPGMYYSWEMGQQAAIGPIFIEPLGHLEKRGEGLKYANGKAKPIKLFGTGHKFFYAQLLMGDNVDNIGGVAGRGPVFAYNLLWDAKTERECYELVAELYVKTYDDEWKVKMMEQANLLWMVRELDAEGNRIGWRPPSKNG